MKERDIAIIGMGCMYPSAPDVKTFWHNIINKVDAVKEVPEGRWDPDLFYDPDPNAENKVYCKYGGYLDTKVPFNPLKYGVMPVAVDGGEPDQFLVLRVAYEAMADAGYLDRKIDGERAELILGRGNYLGAGLTNLIQRGQITEQTVQILKALHPEYSEAELDAIRKEMRAQLPGFQAETAPAIIPNIVTGRVANRLGFMGPNFTIDAACASSLIAVDLAVQDLRAGKVDFAMAGGVHIFTNVPFLMVFGALKALSPTSQVRPYDANADGTIPGEGVGLLVLKRLEDAERDGDRIYAVVKGTGTSSDGKAVSVTAPRVEGEVLALRRAYDDANLSPHTVELIEGHGTGTPAGDAAELETVLQVFGDTDSDGRRVALGTIKSMIGHAMPAAGAAGLIKTAMALYHRVLPPTLNCDSPNSALDGAPVYVNSETRPWIHGSQDTPRRAGINAFGFGGANAHVILEEYNTVDEDTLPTYNQIWESELVLVQAATRQDLITSIQGLQAYVQAAMTTITKPQYLLRDLAYSLNTQKQQQHRLAVVATSVDDLLEKLQRALDRLAKQDTVQIKDMKGIYYFGEHLGGKIAFLFSGEGSQYPNMLGDLCAHFPEVRACFDTADQVLKKEEVLPPSYDVFPQPSFSEAQAEEAEKRLWGIERATTAVLTADGAMYTLFQRLGIQPQLMTGHSAGEWIAMVASGILDIDEFVQSMRRLDDAYSKISQDTAIPEAMMVAVGTDRETITELTAQIEGNIYIANDNCPHQVVIVGQEIAMESMLAQLRQRNLMFERLPYRRGYHTPVFTYMCEPLYNYFASLSVSSPKLPLYSCTTADLYPEDPEDILELASLTFARPLEFRRTIERMYEDGARIFVEIGPKGNLTAFVDDILRGCPHIALPSDVQRRTGLTQLNHVLGLLAAQGISMELQYLYRRREPRRLSFDAAVDFPQENTLGQMMLPLSYPTMSVAERPATQAVLSTVSSSARHQAVISTPATMPSAPAGTNRIQPEQTELTAPIESPAPQTVQATSMDGVQHPTIPTVPAVQSLLNSHTLPTGTHTDQDQVMQEYLRTMDTFLEVQEQVMQASLGGMQAGFAIQPELIAQPLAADRTASETILPHTNVNPPSEVAAPDAQHVAEPASKARSMEPTTAQELLPQPVTEPQMPPQASESLQDVLLSIVSEKTGYPVEMLGLDLDMEAELGIDSIKRIEILGSLQEIHGSTMDQDIDMEAIASLKTLQEVVDFIEAGVTSEPVSATAASVPVLPLVGDIISLTPGQEIVSQRRVDWNEDLFMHDHTFGRELSSTDETLRPLPVVAMTVSIETMAQAASLLFPGKTLIRVHGISARQWIYMEIEETSVDIGIKASVSSPNEAQARIYDPASPDGSSYIEGRFVFGDAFPEAPIGQELVLTNARAAKHTARQLYDDHLMFHGPRYQGIVSLNQVGEDGLLAQLEVLPKDNLFRGNPDPILFTDPFLFDAAGQLVGYWPVEYLDEGYVLFPIQVEELQLFSETPAAGTRLLCQLRIRKLTKQQFSADMDVILPDGRVWMRILGWGDWRFYWSDDFYNFWRFPNKGFMTEPIGLRDGNDRLECRLIKPFGYIENEMWEVLWAHLILNRAERKAFKEMQVGKRRTEWLFGRAAAKDAVRTWLLRQESLQLFPADVEIQNDEYGRPLPVGEWKPQVTQLPQLSIAHTGKLAIAIAGSAPFLGIDIEDARPASGRIERYVLTDPERQLLQEIDEQHRDEWMMRFWCAKEAAAKATGRGLIEGAQSVVVDSFEVQSGLVKVSLGSKLSGIVPQYAGVPICVDTQREDDFVIAVTLGQVE